MGCGLQRGRLDLFSCNQLLCLKTLAFADVPRSLVYARADFKMQDVLLEES